MHASKLLPFPVFILTATPVDEISIPRLFESRNTEIAKLLSNPPELRHGGFGISTGSAADNVRGQLRRAVSEKYNSLELWEDGTVIFLARGDENFLSWGKYSDNTDKIRINPLALVESVYLFVRLCNDLYSKYSKPKPNDIEFTIALKNPNINNIGIMLQPGPITHYMTWDSFKSTKDPEIFSLLRKSIKDIPPEKIAFELVREIYKAYSFDDDKIPYAKEESGQRVIDAEQISIIR